MVLVLLSREKEGLANPAILGIKHPEVLETRIKMKVAHPVHNTSTQALLMIVSNINKDRLADSPGYSL
jgi:hypothetical protein